MHILFLSDNFAPEVNAPASRTYEHAKRWVKMGHQVTVVTSVPNFPAGKIHESYKNKFYQTEYIDCIKVVRVWTYIAPNEGFFRRILDYVSFMISSFLFSFAVRQVDIVVGTSPQFFTAISAWAVSIFKRVPYVFELRDLWPESIKAVDAIKNDAIIGWVEKLEIFLYQRAHLIITVTESFKLNLISRGISEEKIQVVTNGVDTTKFVPKTKDNQLVKRLGLQNEIVVGYIGTMGMAHNLSTVIEAAEIMQNTLSEHKVKFLFVGGGAEKKKLRAAVTEKGLKNVIFVDTVSKLEIIRYWTILDISIVHLKNTPLFHTVIPSKIFEAMAMAKPILHGVNGESALIVKNNDVGLIFRQEDPVDLVKHLQKMLSDTNEFNHMKKNGPIIAKLYDRNRLAEQMLRFLEDLNKKL